MKQFDITNTFDTKEISASRRAEDSACLRIVFDMHLKCMQIQSNCALRALYSPQQYELIKK